MAFSQVITNELHTKIILKKQYDCIRNITKNQDKPNINIILKKTLKNNSYLANIKNVILNNEEGPVENKNTAVALYVEWLDIMHKYIEQDEKELHKCIWQRVFYDYWEILGCEDSEYKERIKYELFKTASLLKRRGVKLLEPLIKDTVDVRKYIAYNSEIKKLLNGGKKNQYILPTKTIEKVMENFCWFGDKDTSGYFDVLLEYFEKRDTQHLPNLQKKIIETDKVELMEKALEKNIISAADRDELLEHALNKKCSKVIMDIILL